MSVIIFKADTYTSRQVDKQYNGWGCESKVLHHRYITLLNDNLLRICKNVWPTLCKGTMNKFRENNREHLQINTEHLKCTSPTFK